MSDAPDIEGLVMDYCQAKGSEVTACSACPFAIEMPDGILCHNPEGPAQTSANGQRYVDYYYFGRSADDAPRWCRPVTVTVRGGKR